MTKPEIHLDRCVRLATAWARRKRLDERADVDGLARAATRPAILLGRATRDWPRWCVATLGAVCVRA
jgi:hypothetical protein